MSDVYNAIYENSLFRPVAPIESTLTNGQMVQLAVETNSPEEILKQATDVYEGLSALDVDAVEHIALNRATFFSRQPNLYIQLS